MKRKKICSKCGNEFKGKFCPECGTPADTTPLTSDNYKQAENSSDTDAAPENVNFTDQEFQATNIPKKKNRKKKIIIIVIVIVILCAIAYGCGDAENAETNPSTGSDLSADVSGNDTAEDNTSKATDSSEDSKVPEEFNPADYQTGITYDNLARNPDDYLSSLVSFSGEVVQIIEGNEIVQARVAVNSDYDNMIFIEYFSSIVPSRVLEGDQITFYGSSAGLITYESTMGASISIPSVYVRHIDINQM